MKRFRILFLATHRAGRAPGQRFRFEQYFPYLRQNGFDCELSHLLSEKDDRDLYKPRNYFRKLRIQYRSLLTRRRDVHRAKSADIVFVFREALLTGSTWFERRLKRTGAKFVYDFDDAIWVLDVSEANRALRWLKNPSKTASIVALSDRVFVGNAFLADYAKRFNPEVVVIPTTIDTDEYLPGRAHDRRGPVTIGWSGSVTTIKHFQAAIPLFHEIRRRFGDRVQFSAIGDADYVEHTLGIRGRPWRRDSEVQDLQAFDIGIMPLPQDEWAMGKCGLKALQYMALEIPAVMSPVGVNSEIVVDGQNGFLASSTEDWLRKLAVLIESPDLRRRMGAAGRQRVIDRYSVLAQRQTYLAEFRRLASVC